MIAWIGFMVGAYIVTRMVELIASQAGVGDSRIVRGLAFATLVIATFAIWVMFVGPDGAFPAVDSAELLRAFRR